MKSVCIHPYDRWMRVTKVEYFLSQQWGVHKKITDHPPKEQWQSLDSCFPLNLHWLALGSVSYNKQTYLDRKYSKHLLYCIVLWVRCHGWTATLHKLKSINKVKVPHVHHSHNWIVSSWSVCLTSTCMCTATERWLQIHVCLMTVLR